MQLLLAATAAAALAAACPPSLIPVWIQDLNTLAGLISFAITVGVWWQVRNVRLAFRSKARLPMLAIELGIARESLDKALRSTPVSLLELHKILGQAAALLASAKGLGPLDSSVHIREAMGAVQRARDRLTRSLPYDAGALSAALGALKAAETGLEQSSQDLEWK
ncbi:hypothetical protein [Mitsuaria sp. GD03876]|uniref:hypothetical protein n=1 Tax=Mitsuaria sp. GD03876 TaxID=2975399 RepID=UPI00244B6B06|nr:hypothetical protein [Mitsuaria sp. GD03876]MDH0866132.1 hypothetical protein [Mitsuaria sp. GD03876]